jgi:hypothetical protein
MEKEEEGQKEFKERSQSACTKVQRNLLCGFIERRIARHGNLTL